MRRMGWLAPAVGAILLFGGGTAFSQGSDRLEVFGQGQRGWFEQQERDAYDRGYRAGREDERRNRLEVFGEGRRGWFEGDDREMIGQGRLGWFDERDGYGRRYRPGSGSYSQRD